MHDRNDRLKEMREDEARKIESERRFRTLGLRTVDEFMRKGMIGSKDVDQNAPCDILVKYLANVKMSLPNGKNIQECAYWWMHGVIPGDDIIEAFELYLEERLTLEFESCRGPIEVSTKANFADRINELRMP